MRRLFWVGDAVASTGFARATHKICDVLRETYEVHVLGINYHGDPHPYPYTIYPAWVPFGDAMGQRRMRGMGADIRTAMPAAAAFLGRGRGSRDPDRLAVGQLRLGGDRRLQRQRLGRST